MHSTATFFSGSNKPADVFRRFCNAMACLSANRLSIQAPIEIQVEYNPPPDQAQFSVSITARQPAAEDMPESIEFDALKFMECVVEQIKKQPEMHIAES
jgi:hypothetical protein